MSQIGTVASGSYVVATQFKHPANNGGRQVNHVYGPFVDRNAARRFADDAKRDFWNYAVKYESSWVPGRDVANVSVNKLLG